MSTVMTDKELASELFDTVCALEAENADLRSGEYLARVIEERDRYRKALEQIASYDDVSACAHLRMTGSYGGFDEPGSVKIAREALESTNEPT